DRREVVPGAEHVPVRADHNDARVMARKPLGDRCAMTVKPGGCRHERATLAPPTRGVTEIALGARCHEETLSDEVVETRPRGEAGVRREGRAAAGEDERAGGEWREPEARAIRR